VSTESAPLIVTASSFMADVVEASAHMPVLVDFWAPWCAPCGQLMPILDRLAQEYAGRLQLAKVNTDEQQELAQQIGIRSLPTVVMFKDRTAVEHFVGVQPESQIRALIEKHLPKVADAPLDRARALKASGDFAGARTLIQQALTGDAENVTLQVELAELRALEGDVEGARYDLERLRGIEPNHAAVKRLAALIEFSEVVAAYPDVRALKERVASNDSDLELRHAIAVHQLLGGDVEPALNTWLDMLRHNRTFKEDLARRSLVLAFELIGDADPIVAKTRREMAKAMF
jgi:putative thioredoxin